MVKPAREAVWSRNYVLAIVVNLLIAIIFYELMTTTALYAVDRFQASGVGAGLATGAFVIGAVVSRLVSGKYLDIIGRRRMLIMTLAACIVLPLLYGVVEPLWVLVVIRGLHGAAFGAGSTAISTGALALIPASRRGEGAGYYGLSTVLGTALGPALGVWLINEVGYPALFASSAVCAALGLAVALVLRLPERTPTEEDRREARRWHPSVLIDVPSLPISSIIFIAGVSFSTVLAFLNNYSRSEGFGEVGGTFFLIYAAAALIARLFVGRIQDRFGNRVVVPPLLAALAAGLAVIAISPTGLALFVSAVLVGFGFGALFPVIQAAAFSMAAPHKVALATSTFYLMADAGIGLGPLVAGALLPLLGYQGDYLLFAVVTVLTLAVYLVLDMRIRERKRRR